LINEEDFLSQEVVSVRRRLGKLDQLSSSVEEYGATLTKQEDRLQGVGWFEKKMKEAHECPVCSSPHPDGNARLKELQTLAAEFRSLTTSVRQAPAKLDQETATLRQELRSLEAKISKARQKRKIIEDKSTQQASQRQRVRQIYLFVGRVEQALENISTSRNVDELREKLKELQTTINSLRKALDPRSQRDRQEAAIASVSARIAFYAKLLQLEHSDENVRLNTRELTLQFNPLSGRTDFLWEVGSGQNWVGYHIAGLLALHEHFIRMESSPVPRFLLIDQPSQVYFPEAWPSVDKASEGVNKADKFSDIEGVKRIFLALATFMKGIATDFQIIVTEHAGSITWEGISDVNVVGNWRENHDEFLIPQSWITKE
jgi:phage shock protein A